MSLNGVTNSWIYTLIPIGRNVPPLLPRRAASDQARALSMAGSPAELTPSRYHCSSRQSGAGTGSPNFNSQTALTRTFFFMKKWLTKQQSTQKSMLFSYQTRIHESREKIFFTIIQYTCSNIQWPSWSLENKECKTAKMIWNKKTSYYKRTSVCLFVCLFVCFPLLVASLLRSSWFLAHVFFAVLGRL